MEYIEYTSILDTDEQAISKPTLRLKKGSQAFWVILSTWAYSATLVKMKNSDVIDKDNFPILTKKIKDLVQQKLKELTGELQPVEEIEHLIRIACEPQSKRDFVKFLHSQKKFQQ